MKGFWGVIALVPLAAGLVLGTAAPASAQDNATCLMCHGRPTMFQGRPDADSLVVSEEGYAASVHGERGLSCIMCHRDLMGASFPHAAELTPPTCTTCHFAVGRTYDESIHGYALSRNNPRAPTCVTCHGRHNIQRSSDPNSQTSRTRLPETCAQCHGSAGLLTQELVRRPEMVSGYTQSVHGRSTANGGTEAASCSDCHGVHNLKGPNDPTSMVNPANIPATCGQCHGEITEIYNSSIHGQALATGVRDSPTCVDCHGEHLILAHDDPEAATCAAQEATRTCGPCHDDPVIVAKYNLQGGVLGTYVDSYHGWASYRGCEVAATCDDCHTAHMVLPAADSASTIHPLNVASTCGRCHEGATARFASSYTHETTSISANPVNRYIRLAYIGIIALVIGGMVIHNLMIMNYFMIERRKQEQRSVTIMRLDRSQVVQHALNALVFIGLVVTGFALRFPEAWWVVILGDLGMHEILRGDLHRVFAVVMVALAFYHLYYILATPRGREEIRGMLPAWKDLTDFAGTVRYYTWRSDKHVKYGRYDYTQKAEYWALVWGTILMALTGFILWFPRQAVQLLPVWAIPAAQTIHYYEAWLATLAILVWHFFFVIFHPDVYPMSWTWMTGKMTEDTVKHHHGEWYDEIKKELHGDSSTSKPIV